MSLQDSVSPLEVPVVPPGLEPRVEAELAAILASSVFHGSRRCSDFLQFIVHEKLAGRAHELKERTIAAAVFERDPLYDPKTDGVVRVRANEVRKRLAQYYQTAGTASQVRIDLPPGSYVPAFEFAGLTAPETAFAPVEPAQNSRLASTPVFAAVIAVLSLALILALVLRPAHAPVAADLEHFWAPLVSGTKPVTVCIVTSPVARLANSSGIAGLLPSPPDRRRFEVPIGSTTPLGSKLIYEVDGQLAVGDALAAAAVSHSLGEVHKPVIVKGGQEVSFVDLKDSPSVLIGAFNNRWAIEINNDLRFHFVRTTGIEDRQTGRIYQSRESGGRVIEDYALVTRLLHAPTGGPLISLGGLLHYGTQSAAEAITDLAHLSQLVKLLPTGWQRRNVQLVVKTTLVQERPGRAEIVAVHVW